MIKTILVFSDGSEVSSGSGSYNAVMRSDIQDNCNDGEDLTIGSVCASVLTVDLITPHNDFCVGAGETVTVYEDCNGERRKKGVFVTEKPQKKNSNSTRITAYDNISLFDKDLTEWFNGLDRFPYTAYEMAVMTCEKCGVEFKNKNIMNGEVLINAVQLPSVTGRQIMRWVGEICGCFCISDENGMAKYDWYKLNNNRISPRRGNGYTHFLRGSLSYEDYTVKKIDGVNIRSEASDSGTVYPTESELKNPYIMNGNPLILSCSNDDISLIAKNTYETLREVEYTPSKVGVNSSFSFCVGDIIEIEDINGNVIRSYVMKKHRKGQTETLESRGNKTREGAHSLYSNDFRDSYQEKVKNKQSIASVSQVAKENKAQIDILSKWVGENENGLESLAEIKAKADANEASITALAKRATDSETLIAQIDQEVDEERARIDLIAEFQTKTETNIAEIELDVSENEASIKTLTEWKGSASKTIAETSVKATANEASIKSLTTWKGTASSSIASLGQRATANEASIKTLTEWKGTASSSIASIEQKANGNGAKIELVVGTGASGNYIKGGIIAQAINGQTGVKISADVLDIVGKKLNIKVDAANITGKLTASQINSDGINVKKGEVGWWVVGFDENFTYPMSFPILRAKYGFGATVLWGDGTANETDGWCFIALTWMGIYYIVKKFADYTSATLAVLPDWKIAGFKNIRYPNIKEEL